ncbi:YHS domain-containing (seleno)protein [Rhizobium ruizarguesonis]|uniref:YHS domain-containing (seleno)protein n=1 Tax=Rhizobium ruizarguesonis TaxID=2081791 RepID=UPI0010319A6B|nr:YHS domain-containing (seleno)protein [Rhizobium ruizarguesonis]TAY72569.1 YHS domain-containing protein [Rhizobium ruizarguesonis]
MVEMVSRRKHAKPVHFVRGAACLALMLTCSAPAFADGTVNTGYFGGVAIGGYDTVAYFLDNKAVKGSEKYSYEWLGTPWYFASEAHRELFKANPAKYAPQYGGYCAAEVAETGSVTVNIDPETFAIVDGKLYITYDKVHTQDFAAHVDAAGPKADANWPKKQAELAQNNYR